MKLNWSAWQTIAASAFTGNPQLSIKGNNGRRMLSCTVMDRFGNLWEVDEKAPNHWTSAVKLGGNGTIGHAPVAQHRPVTVVTGQDQQLWKYRRGTIWALTGGNGRLCSETVQVAGNAGNMFYAGIGIHQNVWWGHTEAPDLKEWQWRSLGKPAGSGPVTQRPAVSLTYDGPHVIVRGENGRLFDKKCQNGTSWQDWRFVADNVRSLPVTVTRNDHRHVECFYFRQDDGALGWAVWNGEQWHQPHGGRLGGQLLGIPAVAASMVADRTFVFARGTENGSRSKLWYIIRDGSHWSSWQADDQGIIASSPSILAVDTAGNERLVCVALNLEGALVQRTCTITA